MTKLEFQFDKQSHEKYYIQLYKIFTNKISSGVLKAGSKMPSIRKTALNLKININTVLQAYNLLEQNGYIEKIHGKGSYVKKISDFSLDQKVKPLLDSFKHGQIIKNKIINFSNGTPPSEYFPAAIYQDLSNRIINTYHGDIFSYQDVQGVLSLRKVLADDLEKDDIFVNPEEIIITSGTQQSLDIILKLFKNSSNLTVGLSAPTYPNALNIFSNSCNIKSIDLKNDGWNMEEFEEILKREKIKLVYEVINFQNPTGIKWSDSKKQKLLKLAKKYDFYIIEDDSFSEFYYTDNRPFPLKSFDQVDHERIIYIKTYSKSIMPGLGLALVIPPKKLIEKSIFIKYGLDTNTSGLNQKILELFIKEQYLEEHLTFLRQEFKEKYLYMIKLLSEVPYITVLNIPEGGFFIWILLSQHIKGELFYEKCKESNLSILPGSVFYNDKLSTYKIRLTFVSANLKEIKEGIETIKNILLTCAPPKNNKSKIIL